MKINKKVSRKPHKGKDTESRVRTLELKVIELEAYIKKLHECLVEEGSLK